MLFSKTTKSLKLGSIPNYLSWRKLENSWSLFLQKIKTDNNTFKLFSNLLFYYNFKKKQLFWKKIEKSTWLFEKVVITYKYKRKRDIITTIIKQTRLFSRNRQALEIRFDSWLLVLKKLENSHSLSLQNN